MIWQELEKPVAFVLGGGGSLGALIDLIRGVEGVVAVRPAVGYRLDDRNLAVSAGMPPY
jgi:hypothetical protein